MPEFVPGIELARSFYEDVVANLVGDARHSAALIGAGSEVLGFDTARSTDHAWGPRLQVFVEPAHVPAVRAAVGAGLPETFRGWPTRFGSDRIPVSQHVLVLSLGEWLRDVLGFDPRAQITPREWLSTPQQRLLEATAGAVFHDGLGELLPVRETLAWYPRDVWLWLLACQWRRLEQEEPFVGRTAEVGDDLGSRILAARLARDLIRLCFLLERRYAPYSKWLGSAFRRLEASAEIGPPLERALAADDKPAREAALVEAFEAVARRQNVLGLTRAEEPTVKLFHERPFRVLGSGRFVDACLEALSDPWLRSLPPIGGIGQFVDSTDVLTDQPVFRRLGAAAFRS
jgi:Domain of unknown function (DUF4037)